MAAKKRRAPVRKLPLEWVKKTKAMATKATVYTETLDLDLLQNEIAEVWQIATRVHFPGVAAAGVADLSRITMYLSMNPDADKSPIIAANLEDLEVFYDHDYTVSTVVEATSTSVQRFDDGHISSWKALEGRPILVGTNVGVVGEWDSTANMYTSAMMAVRIWFTRRVANVSDLNQILLKRR
jgi:hypothetical protein